MTVSEQVAHWRLPIFLGVALIAVTEARFCWNVSERVQRIQAENSKLIATLSLNSAKEMSALKERLAQVEHRKSQLNGDVAIATNKLRITQLELRNARAEAGTLNDVTANKLSALDSSSKTELATKASAKELRSLNEDVDAVHAELEATRNDLAMAKSEMSALIARNQADIAQQTRRKFPWPAPRWTTRVRLPDGLVVSTQGEEFEIVFRRLLDALHHGRISDWSTYPVGAAGFAIICRMETIDDRGVAEPEPQRWSVDPMPPNPWEPWPYIRALFLAPPGRFRVIVLVVIDESATQTDLETTSDELNVFLEHGATDIPDRIKHRITTADTRCEAIVYEFQKRRRSDDARFVVRTNIKTVRHLSGAMLWSLSQLKDLESKP